MKIELKENSNSVKITANDGGFIEDHSVSSVLLFQILLELKTLNGGSKPHEASAEVATRKND